MADYDMTVARYYYENLDNLVAFLATKPDGKLSILIGTDGKPETVTSDLFRQTAMNVSLAKWLIAKLDSGELTFKADAKTDLPQEVNLTTYTGRQKS